MSFSVRIPVRFRDVDVLGHVNNAVYFTYMETARTEYWMKLFDLQRLDQLSFIVAHAECDFKIAAKFGDELEISIRTTEIRNTSFVWQYEMRNVKTSEVVAMGKTVQVYYDYATMKGLPVPEDVRKKLVSS
ncbi:MAG: acyl-CoA thioesterase [Acidobacteria bacterium]|nr:MAG: acyl-CoA thioesterase [Acidobacteriota bacterium]